MASHKQEYWQTTNSKRDLHLMDTVKYPTSLACGNMRVDQYNSHYTQKYYEITINKEGSLYCGITLKWNYKNRTLDISMPGYVEKQLQKYNYPKPMKLQHCPWELNPKMF
ncbi:hypothetical protein ACHAW6_008916 [Cyclotella cf. meneghiniana]